MSTPRSFARAFSTHRKDRPDMEISVPAYFSRIGSSRNSKPTPRPQISSPVALLSTSNVHVKTAHAIAGTVPIEIRKISTTSSPDSVSSDDSDGCFSSTSSNGAMTDASSVDESPVSLEPESNQLSYGKPTTTVTGGSLSQSPTELTALDEETPKIPQRAPSHSKKAHEGLHRKRSIQRLASIDIPRGSLDTSRTRPFAQQPTSTSAPSSAAPLSASYDSSRSSFDIIGQRSRAAPPAPSSREITSPTTIEESPRETPFDDELAQLREAVQEFGANVRTEEEDADVLQMEKRGLATFSAADYVWEIQSLVHSMFAEEQPCFRQMAGFF